MVMSNYAWYLEQDLSKYAGKWVAITQKKVVAAHQDIAELTKTVSKQFKLSDVSFTRISDAKKALVY